MGEQAIEGVVHAPDPDPGGPISLPADIVAGVSALRPELVRLAARSREGEARAVLFLVSDLVQQVYELNESCKAKEAELEAHRNWRAKARSMLRYLASNPLG